MVDQISVMVEKIVKLAIFMFMMMEYCCKPYNIKCINSREGLAYR